LIKGNFTMPIKAGATAQAYPCTLASTAVASEMSTTVSVNAVLATRRTSGRLPQSSEDHLRERMLRLETALNNMSQGLCMFDSAERLVVCNTRYLQMFRLAPEQVMPGCRLVDLLRLRTANGTFSRDIEEYRRELMAAITEGRSISKIVELADGRVTHVVTEPLPDGGWVVTHEDITEQRSAERELSRMRTFLDTIIESIPAMVLVKDARDLRYVLINHAGEELLGVSRDDIIGKDVYDFFPKEQAEHYTQLDHETLWSGRRVVMGEHELHTPHNGARFVSTKKIAILGDKGDPEYLLTVTEDITERRRAEEQIAHLAHHDTLTGLPNRAVFNEQLAMTLARASATGQSFAVLCLDLDRFKEINDVFGHSVGDALLRGVAERLKAAGADVFIARLGGDEFTLIVADHAEPSAVSNLADRLLAAMAEDFEIEGHRLRVGLSVGVAIYPVDGADATALLGNADAALYRAKAEGRNVVRFFEAEMDRHLRERRALQHDLRSAIERGQIALHYQPQAGIGRDVLGFEALVRWWHPTRGLILPSVFIPLAEESGLIISIGEWILREACREAASWARPLQIAVNLSPMQFRYGDLPTMVHTVLLETGIDPCRLELEITESVLIGDFSRTVSTLRRLKALGVRISMDDFGTGYSSLSYLQSFPFDKIKIDQAFIANLDRNPQSAAIVRAVIGLGRGLALPVVAEGVETEEQLEFLHREDCKEVQGYLIGRPRPIEDYAEMVGRPARARKTQIAV
jgi:diguanylate cyclase (GGDEF)-like protein/PAS domain S-box-containing protein